MPVLPDSYADPKQPEIRWFTEAPDSFCVRWKNRMPGAGNAISFVPFGPHPNWPLTVASPVGKISERSTLLD